MSHPDNAYDDSHDDEDPFLLELDSIVDSCSMIESLAARSQWDRVYNMADEIKKSAKFIGDEAKDRMP